MTIPEFIRDLKSHDCCYVVFGEDDPASSVEATLHISEVFARAEYPTAILFSDGINMMLLTQVNSISFDGSTYTIVCGVLPGCRESVKVKVA